MNALELLLGFSVLLGLVGLVIAFWPWFKGRRRYLWVNFPNRLWFPWILSFPLALWRLVPLPACRSFLFASRQRPVHSWSDWASRASLWIRPWSSTLRRSANQQVSPGNKPSIQKGQRVKMHCNAVVNGQKEKPILWGWASSVTRNSWFWELRRIVMAQNSRQIPITDLRIVIGR